MEQIKVKKFRLKNLQFPCNILMIGPSASRKNAAVRKVLNLPSLELHNDDEVLIVSSNPDLYSEEDFAALPAEVSIFGGRGSTPSKRDLESKALACRVHENVLPSAETPMFDANRELRCCIQTLDGYTSRVVPQSAVACVDYVFLFGGISASTSDMRRIWDDYGYMLPRVKDFKQIYLACTEEGDRYCDDFLVLKMTSANDSDDGSVFYWSSLRRDPVKDIAVSVELVLNRVQQAQEVELPAPKASVAHTSEDAMEEAERRMVEAATGGGGEAEADEEREERECRIL